MSLPPGTKPDLALSTAVRSLRWKKGLTRERLAYESGLTNGTVARIELGQACPSWESVRRIASALQMPTSEFVIEVEAVERTDAHKIRVEIRERESAG
jgi:transcriptional regulator with XRE-family HTH domain